MRTSGWWSRTNVGVLTVAAIVASRGVLIHTVRLATMPPSRARGIAPFPCDAVSEHDIIAPVARIDSGEYTLTLVAANGTSSGASVRGRLWLRRASMLDTSSVASTRALVADTAGIPLYGAARIDFAGVGASVAERGSGAIPDPRSFDPVRPGVLVTHHTSKAIGEGRWRLLIGTTANNRHIPCDSAGPCPPTPTAGTGIALSVRRIDHGEFAGEWAPVGDDSGARGYFCAVPVHYFGYPYPQRLHVP
jgi:hypothetical protein